MEEGLHVIERKIAAFRRKYYFNLFIKGALLTALFVLVYILIASFIEYNLWLSRTARLFIFGSFFLLVGFCVFKFLKQPLQWWISRKGLNEEDSARLIGNSFPTVNDKLLNLIQLSHSAAGTALVKAGVIQKSRQFENIPFESAINLRENSRYLKYLLIPAAVALGVWVFNRDIFTQSTTRIVQFNREFSPAAPFEFHVNNESLNAFFNEDFTLNLSTLGKTVPEHVYIVIGDQRYKMQSPAAGEFAYTFEKIQRPLAVQFEASGFFSDPINISIVNRPELTGLSITLNFPKYLGRKSELLLNAGNLEVPEGTTANWRIGTAHADQVQMRFSTQPETTVDVQRLDNQSFGISKNIRNPEQYAVMLNNQHSTNRESIEYTIQVIKDQYPEITVEQLRDSLLFKNVVLAGAVKDDYGVTDLRIHYTLTRQGSSQSRQQELNIPISPNQRGQNFLFQWNLDSLKLQSGDALTYYLQVWDNDGVNGRKATKSARYEMKMPGREELEAQISQSQSATQSKIDQSLNRAKDLRESIEEAQRKLKGKQQLEWQDKKMLEELIDQKKQLDEVIQDLQQENELLQQKKDTFSPESERLKEKAEQIQKLMNELLDDETKKMFEELEKLLKENADQSQMQKLLDKMSKKEINLEKELERTLQLFKQLQYDYKMEQAINQLKEQVEKQEQLLQQTEQLEKEQTPGDQKSDQEKKGDNTNQEDEQSKDGDKQGERKSSEELAEEQEQLSEEFSQFEEAVKELNELGEEIDEPANGPSQEEMDNVKQSQQESEDALEKGDTKKSKQSQKNSISKMKQMQQQMESMQNAMEMEINMENLESLRQIIHGLVKLSYDEESLMKEFAAVQQTDPRFIALSQEQLKLQDDAKVLEDSLLALGKRDPFMGSIVTREVGELKDHVAKTLEHLRERRKANAQNEMQLSMTSMNNLALMLNDHFEMMMDMMANAKPSRGKKKGKQQSLGEMQMKLNQQMEEIRRGGKTGRELSEEMAKMAAEQERIRRALQEMQEKLKQEGGKPLGNDIPGKMEQTEMELVNKQLTEQTIRRQQEILTRLLEAEKSMREQNLDEERKGETAKEYQKEIPRAFEEYLRLKEKEVELLKTVPPKLYLYYKREVGEYFKRIGTQD